jgi:hypothetical protein
MAVRDIGWAMLAPNSSSAWFIHGWGAMDAVTYSIVVFPGIPLPGVPYPAAHATLTQGESFKWAIDGTFAHTVYVTNNAPFNSCDVHLLATVESL